LISEFKIADFKLRFYASCSAIIENVAMFPLGQIGVGNPHWMKQMTNRDLAALSPLLTLHINPYGRFELDLEARLPIEEALAA
jgi:hypothetical protein